MIIGFRSTCGCRVQKFGFSYIILALSLGKRMCQSFYLGSKICLAHAGDLRLHRLDFPGSLATCVPTIAADSQKQPPRLTASRPGSVCTLRRLPRHRQASEHLRTRMLLSFACANLYENGMSVPDRFRSMRAGIGPTHECRF